MDLGARFLGNKLVAGSNSVEGHDLSLFAFWLHLPDS